jgi:hypothetical protein
MYVDSNCFLQAGEKDVILIYLDELKLAQLH